MTHVTCRLTAKNRDQLWNPTLGNRVWATFTFITLRIKRFIRERKVGFFFLPHGVVSRTGDQSPVLPNHTGVPLDRILPGVWRENIH